MKTLKTGVLALIPTALFVLAACATTPSGEEDVAVMETPDGAVIIETFRTSAEVTAIDAEKRKVTLKTSDGKKTTFKAGPEVVNFDQIQVGDQVKATVTEEIAVSVRRDGEAPSDSAAGAVAVAPVGAKPGVLMADTVEVSAKITAIDAKHRKVTLEFADGTTKKVKVGKKADLTKVSPGDTVTIRLTEGIAIVVERA